MDQTSTPYILNPYLELLGEQDPEIIQRYGYGYEDFRKNFKLPATRIL